MNNNLESLLERDVCLYRTSRVSVVEREGIKSQPLVVNGASVTVFIAAAVGV
jgi:hypothetical protein